MYNISELKVGDVMVRGSSPNRQMFYIHSIDVFRNKITTSGVSEKSTTCFEKADCWRFDKKATEEEKCMFYELIERRGFKFNLNTGVKRC